MQKQNLKEQIATSEVEQPTTYSREEVMSGLREAIDMQKLQTELQELRTRMITAKANEYYSMMKIDEILAREQPIQTETKPESKEPLV